MEQVAVIERRCFPDPWSENLLREMLTHPRAVNLAAIDDRGHVLGYAGFQWVLDEGDIQNIAVDTPFRRQGIAGALLTALATAAREKHLRLLTLEVRASNAPAQALYLKYGYTPVGRRKNYYIRPREDAILMTWKMKEE